MVTVYSSAAFSATFGKETSYGSGSTGGTSYGALGVGMSLDTFTLQNQLDYLYQLGQRAPKTVYTAGRSVDISSKFVLANDSASTGNWLNFVMASTTANSWSVGTQSSSYLQINTGAGNLYEVGGIAFDTAGLAISNGKPVEVTLTGKGQNVTRTTATSTTVSFPTSPVTWTGVDLSIDGVAVSQPVTELNLSIKNNNQMFYTLGSVEYTAFVPTKFEVSGDMTILHGAEPSYESEIFLNDTTGSAVHSLSFTAGVSSAPNVQYTFTIDKIYWNSDSIHIVPIDPVTDKIEFRGISLTVSVA